MEIKARHNKIPLMIVKKVGPNSSVSGNDDVTTYTVKCLRSEKTLPFTEKEIQDICSFLKPELTSSVIPGYPFKRPNWELIRSNGDNFTLNFQEVEELYIAILSFLHY